jgi:hypothetical protein
MVRTIFRPVGKPLAAAASIAVVAGSFSYSPGASAVAPRRAASGVPQCVRAEAARFLNVPADYRAARHGARTYPLVAIEYVDRMTVFVWERQRGKTVHRVYVLRPGRHGMGSLGQARRAAAKRKGQDTGPFNVLLSDYSRAATRRLDRVCLHRRIARSGEVAACLKAEGTRVMENSRANRIVARRARNYPIVGVRYAAGDTVVIWERASPTLIRRVYLDWPGNHGNGSPTLALRRRAVRLVVRTAAHPHRARFGVTFSNGTRREARRLEKFCLHSRP